MVSGGKRGLNTAAPPPVTALTEEEELMKESGESAIMKSHSLLTTWLPVLYIVARFARERVQPLVRKMDEESQMDPSIITDMFDQGVSRVHTECPHY